MSRSPSNSLPLLITAIDGFVNYKTAEGLSDRSVDSYRWILEQQAEYAGNKKVAKFTDRDINAYLAYMRTEYVPRRFGGSTRALSPKSLRNSWITMCSFFTWASTEFWIESPMKSVPIPCFQKVDVEPFTQDDRLNISCFAGCYKLDHPCEQIMIDQPQGRHTIGLGRLYNICRGR